MAARCCEARRAYTFGHGPYVALDEVRVLARDGVVDAEAAIESGARQEKASLSHLLNDKSPLIRTPSPEDAATPSVISASKSSSSISTPSTVPSLSDIFSPGVHQYRGTSLPAMTGPPRLIPKTQNAGAKSPPCRREAAPAKARGDGEQGRETAEQDALRALVVMQSSRKSSTAMSVTGASKAEAEVNRVHKGRVLPDAFDSRLYGAGSGKQLATAKKGKQNFRGVTWDKVKQVLSRAPFPTRIMPLQYARVQRWRIVVSLTRDLMMNRCGGFGFAWLAEGAST